MRRALYLAGRAVGVVCGAGVAAGWVMAMWFPEAGLPLSGMPLVVALMMLLLAIIGVIASVHGHAIVLVLVFVASFLPVGFHLLGLPNWFRWIGWLNVGFVLAGLLVWAGAPARRHRSASDGRTTASGGIDDEPD